MEISLFVGVIAGHTEPELPSPVWGTVIVEAAEPLVESPLSRP